MERFDHLFIQPRDYNKAFQFYTEVLGFKVTDKHGDAKDAGRLAYLDYNGSFKMVLAEDHDPSDPEMKTPIYQSKGRISMHFQTADVDAAFKKIPPGDHVKLAPENTHWGTRWFMVEDPDGNQFAWQGPPK